MEMQTGIQQQTPLEWPFTQLSNEDQVTNIRLSMITHLLHWATCNVLLYRLPQRHSGYHWSSFASCVLEPIYQ